MVYRNVICRYNWISYLRFRVSARLVTAVRFIVSNTPGLGNSLTATTVRAGRCSPMASAYAAFIASKSAMLLRKMVMCTASIQVGPDGFQHYLERSQDLRRVCAAYGPRQLPGRRIHAPAVPPIQMCSPTFAT